MQELYTLTRAFKRWEHYLITKQFNVHSDHRAL